MFEVLLEKPVDLLQQSTSLGSDVLVSEIRQFTNIPRQFVLVSSFIQDTFHEVVSRQQSTYAAGEH